MELGEGVREVKGYLCPCGFVHLSRRSADKCAESHDE